MPVTWYLAPFGAKTFRGPNAFSSGIWDRDTPEQNHQLGDQPPYNSPYFKGWNLWAYTGQCVVGSAHDFEYGISKVRAEAPPPDVPECCRPPEEPQGPVHCPWYPSPPFLAPPMQLILLVQPTGRTSGLISDFISPLVAYGDTSCDYGTTQIDIPGFPGAFLLVTLEEFGTTVELLATGFGPIITWSIGPRLDTFPQTIPYDFPPVGLILPPWQGLAESTILIYPYVPGAPAVIITLAGDVNGTGTDLIVTTLASISTPGTYGDATDVPQITIDAAGRVVAVTLVPITGGSVGIGLPVAGATPNSVLYVDSAGNLAQDNPAFTYGNAVSGEFAIPLLQVQSGEVSINSLQYNFPSVASINNQVLLSDISGNLSWSDAADGAYSAGNPSDWSGAAPAQVGAALDRLAAWITANFPLLTPP